VIKTALESPNARHTAPDGPLRFMIAIKPASIVFDKLIGKELGKSGGISGKVKVLGKISLGPTVGSPVAPLTAAEIEAEAAWVARPVFDRKGPLFQEELKCSG